MKKTIAKEIIYFFSVISLLLIIWAGIEIRNTYLSSKMNNYTKEISDIKIQIDSIEKNYPKKAKTYNELFGEKPLGVFEPPSDGIEIVPANGNDLKGTVSWYELLTTTEQIFNYLARNKFDFNIFKFEEDEYGIPVKKPITEAWLYKYGYDHFDKSIKTEYNLEKQPNIEMIYNFIKSKNKKFNCNITNFVFWLKGLPPLPSLEILDKLDALKKSKQENIQIQKETENKILGSNETKSTIVWYSTFLFGLLYPCRFVFFLLKWAFKTVKQRE